MSRRTIEPLNPNHTVIVGYDRGMSTYFAQVVDTEIERLADEAAERVAEAHDRGTRPSAADETASEQESMILWIGAGMVNEIPTVEDLAAQLAPYAIIEPEMIRQLREDQERAGQPTGAQQAMQEFISALRDGV